MFYPFICQLYEWLRVRIKLTQKLNQAMIASNIKYPHLSQPYFSSVEFSTILLNQIMIGLLKKVRFQYISIIKKHPRGVVDRMQRFDQWAQSWNDPNIKTYKDLFENGENPKFQVCIPDSPSSKNDQAQCATRYRPSIFEMSEYFTINDNPFADDQLLSVDKTELKFSKFVRQGLKKQTRSDLHRFFFWSLLAAILGVIGFYRGVIDADYQQQVVDLQPDQRYYHYSPHILQYEVKQFIYKINTINRHSIEVLQAAKQRAQQRIANSKL